jgi:hypothetical protein
MRRDPLIINLHDKPQSRRSYRRYTAPPSASGATAALMCAAIAGCVAVFFWVYDATAHREPSFVPALARDVGAGPPAALAATILIPPVAPPPDLDSPAVALANADVPPAPAEPQAAATKGQGPAAAEKPKKAEVQPKKKRVHVVKRFPPAAAQAYASDPGFFGPPFGRF